MTMFRADDHVHHGPSGEDWVLACDEENGEVIPAGWPEGIAKAADCMLLRAATDAQRLDMLQNVVRGGRGGPRYSRAQRQLDAMEPTHLGVTAREIDELAGLEVALTRARHHLNELHRLRSKPTGLPGESLTKSAQEALQDLAANGVRVNLDPPEVEQLSSIEEVKNFWSIWARRLFDKDLRQRARLALVGQAADEQ
jgi:hypothetical protein